MNIDLNEYDYEVDAAREWLGIDDDRPLTFGDAAWMAVQLIGASAIVVGGGVLAGIACGVI